MLDVVLADMKRGNIDAIEIRTGGGTEVWRKNLIKRKA